MTDAVDQLYERMLIARCQAGDEAAFAEIVGRFQGRLRYYLRKIVGADANLDDILQDVWLDVFRSLTKLNDPAAFPAWIYRLARDRAFREWRKSQRDNSKSIETSIEEFANEAESDFTAEDARMVHECLDELTPEHREVLVLRFLESMSYEDIAGVVGCNVGTIRSRLHYGKLALRAAIEKRERK